MLKFSQYNFFLLFALLSLTAIYQETFSQFEPAPVSRSKEKMVHRGKVYYVHTVRKGQTFYSICQAYGVTEKDVKEANPDLNLDVLSVDQVIKIPAEEKTITLDLNDNPDVKNDFIYHTVLPGQTIYYIHQKYNIPLEILYKYNPESETVVKTGDVLRIPKTYQSGTVITDKKTPDEANTYIVKADDTLYNLSKRFGVPVADIVNANEELRWGLKAGQMIIIPGVSGTMIMTSDIAPFTDTFLIDRYIPQWSSVKCDSLSRTRKTLPLKIALLLPFFSSENFESDYSEPDSIDDDLRFRKPIKGKGAAEFYEGVLLALDSLRKTDIEIDLYVFDTESDSNKVRDALNQLGSVIPDMIIGPFYSENTKMVSDFCKTKKILCIMPLVKDDTLTCQNPYVVQVSPSLDSEIKASADYLSQFWDQNIVIVYKKSLLVQDEINKFKKALYKSFLQRSGLDSVIFKEVIIDESYKSKLKLALREDTKNLVILFSSNEPEVSNIFSQLSSQLREKEIEVFGLPSWQKFKNIGIDYFHDLSVSLYSPFYIDYNDPYVNSFIYKCKDKLGFEPYKTTSKGTGINYTFMGYDIMCYAVEAYRKYGKNTCNCMQHFDVKLLLSHYDFQRSTPYSCLENAHVNIIKYTKDLTIENVVFQPLP